MRHAVSMTLAACLLTAPALAHAAESLAGGALATTARAQYCARSHESDFYAAWVKNHCNKAPYGPRFEYLRPAWDCLCLGRD